jgi:hypothetical protein
MMRAVVWGQLLIVLTCVGYSTYSLFKGDFEQAFLPYPILILYYLIFSRTRTKRPTSSEELEEGVDIDP